MLLNFLFVGTLVAMEFRGPHTGLALASSAAAYINAALLYRGLRRQGVYRPEPGWFRVAGAVVLGSLVMVAVLLWQYGAIDQWSEASATARTIRLTTLIGIGMLVYALLIIAGGLRKHHLVKGAS